MGMTAAANTAALSNAARGLPLHITMAETLPFQAYSLDMPVDCLEISGLDRAVSRVA